MMLFEEDDPSSMPHPEHAGLMARFIDVRMMSSKRHLTRQKGVGLSGHGRHVYVQEFEAQIKYCEANF